MSHGVQMQGSFTWGKSLDNNSAGVAADSFGNFLSSLPWYDYRLTKAVSDYNIGKTLSLSTTWQVPGPKSSGFASALLGGWEVGGIFTAHDGLPVTPLTGVNYQNSQDPFAFPDRLTGPGCNSLVNPGSVNNYIKTQCFSMPTLPSTAAPQTFYNASCDPGSPFPTCANLRGNAGRNIIIGPGLLNFDFSLFKNMPVKRISEKFNIHFRAEFFTVLNKPTFHAPSDTTVQFASAGTPQTAGVLDSMVTDSRDIQFALKFVW